jgi:hypothetical protein
MKHRHSYKIIKVIALKMFTEFFYEKCECGRTREYYKNPAGKFDVKYGAR